MKIRILERVFIFCLLAFASSIFVSAQSSANVDKPTETYRIKAGDKLSVKFLNHPELNELALTVRPDGFISLQLIEDIKTEGLTTTELKKRIEKNYEEILLNPIISVILPNLCRRRFLSADKSADRENIFCATEIRSSK